MSLVKKDLINVNREKEVYTNLPNKDVRVLLKSKGGGVGRAIRLTKVKEEWQIIHDTVVFY